MKPGESSESYHSNHGHHPDLGSHAQRLSSNIDNSIETRLPSTSHRTSIKRNHPSSHPGSPEKLSNVRTVGQYPGREHIGVRSTIYLNQDCGGKAYLEEKAYLNPEEPVADRFYSNNPGQEVLYHNRGDQKPESLYHNNPGEAEVTYDEDREGGEDLYTDGFSPPLQAETNDVYQNHDVNQDTYNEYDEQTYNNNGVQAYHNNGNYSNSGIGSNSNNHSNDGNYNNHSNDGNYCGNYNNHSNGNSTPHEDYVRGDRDSIYENHDVVIDSSEDEFIEFEDVSVYMNQPEL